MDYLTRKCAGAGDCDEDWLRNRDVMLVVGKTTFLPGHRQGVSLGTILVMGPAEPTPP